MANFENILKECTFKTSRSSGAGGQHVNKVESRVELIWNIEESAFLTKLEKERVIEKLSSKIDNEGFIHVISQEKRTQLANRKIVQSKFVNLIIQALKIRKKRKKTKLPKSIKEKRLLVKRIKSENKKNRRKVQW